MSKQASRKPTLLLILVLAMTSVLAMTPLGARADGVGLELTITPTDVAAGDEVSVSGEGFAADSAIELFLTGPGGDAELGQVTADGEGDFSQTVTIPGTATPGLYVIRAVGNEEGSASISIGAMANMPVETEAPSAPRDRSVGWQVGAVVVLAVVGLLGLTVAWRVPRHVDTAPAGPPRAA